MPKDSSAQSGPTAGGNVRAISHWSNVAPGEYFTVTFEESDRIPAHLEQSQFIGKEVKLMRDSGSGFTVSCHDDWSYQATVNSDTRYHALTSAASKIKYWGVKKPKKSGVITNFFQTGPSLTRNSVASFSSAHSAARNSVSSLSPSAHSGAAGGSAHSAACNSVASLSTSTHSGGTAGAGDAAEDTSTSTTVISGSQSAAALIIDDEDEVMDCGTLGTTSMLDHHAQMLMQEAHVRRRLEEAAQEGRERQWKQQIEIIRSLDDDQAKSLVKCAGYMLPLTGGLFDKYPFHLHDSDPPLRWTVPNDKGVVFSKKCTSFKLKLPVLVAVNLPGPQRVAPHSVPLLGLCTVEEVNSLIRADVHIPVAQLAQQQEHSVYRCDACLSLSPDSASLEAAALGKIVSRANDPHFHKSKSHHKYFTFDQLLTKYKSLDTREGLLSLQLWKNKRKLQKLDGCRSDAQRLIQLLASNKIPRVNHHLQQMIKDGCSVARMTRIIAEAVDGDMKNRRQRGLSADEIDISELVLMLGGPKCLWALQRTDGFASVNSVKKMRGDKVCFVFSWDHVRAQTVALNMQNFVCRRDPPSATPVIYHIIFDGVAMNEHPAPSPIDGYMKGYAVESDSQGISLQASSYANLMAMKQAEEAGNLLLGCEAEVYALGANSEHGYAISCVAANATRKKGASHTNMVPILKKILDEWDHAHLASRGRIVCIDKDGAAINNLAAFRLCTEFEMDKTCSVGKFLFGEDAAGLLLFFSRCGRSSSYYLIDSSDDKHVDKRFRMNAKSADGLTVRYHTFKRADLTDLLHDTGVDLATIENMWGEEGVDAQNVPATMKFLLGLASFEQKTLMDFPNRQTPTFPSMLKELQLIGRYAALLFECCTTQCALSANTDMTKPNFLSVSQLAVRASELAHILFVLFRYNRSKFVPAQHYYNTMIMIRAKYVCIAHAQDIGMKDFWWYQASSDRIEQAFSSLRAQGTGSNFNGVELEERITSVMRMEEIYCRNPHLRRPSRRLSSVSLDHLNPTTILGSPPNRSIVSLEHVHLPTCWLQGRMNAMKVLSMGDDPIFDADHVDFVRISQQECEGVRPDMLRPFGGISKPNGYVGVETTPADLPASSGADDSLGDADDGPSQDGVDGDDGPRYDDDNEEADFSMIAPVADFFRDAQEQQAGEEEDFILNVQVSDKARLHRIKDMPGFTDPPWITASQAVRLIRSPHYNTTPDKSSDRMRRVQGMTKWIERKVDEEVGLPEESIFDNITVHIDPILIMVRHAVCGVTMVLAMPQSFSTVNHGKNRRRLKLSMLSEPGTMITAKLLTAVQDTVDGAIVFPPRTMGETIKVQGWQCAPCRPDMQYDEAGKPTWSVKIQILSIMLNLRFTGHRMDGGEFPIKSLLTLKDDRSYYKGADGQLLAVVEGTAEMPASVGTHGVAKGGGQYTCGVCRRFTGTGKALRQHIGGHLLESDWANKYGKEKPVFACGLCGERESHGVKPPKDPDTLGGCFMYFNGAQAVHHCKLVTEEKPYGSHASAAKSRWKGRAPEPCSNVPMKCPFKCKEIFWKWSMMKHLTEKHASAAHQMTDASRQQFGLRAHERHYTMALFNNPGKLLENACPKESAPKSPHECDCV